jgi:chromosome partitioning protein
VRTWTVANQKGGVGKTTTAVTLGYGLAEAGRRVLLVDLDPHASLTQYLGFTLDPPAPGVFELFTAGTPVADLARHTGTPRLDLLPAQPALATLDRRFQAQEGRGLVLARALAAVAADYDYAILDCAPTLGLLQVNALAAADHLIITAQTEPLSLAGVASLWRTQEMIQQSRGRALPALIVPTLFDRRTRAGVDSRAELLRRYDGAVWEDAVPVDTRLRDASREHCPVWVLDPDSRGAQAYRHLLETLLARDAAGGGAGTGARPC